MSRHARQDGRERVTKPIDILSSPDHEADQPERANSRAAGRRAEIFSAGTLGQEEKRMPPMSIVFRAIDQLKPDPANPRRHSSKKQIRQIADSMKAFGFNVPILIDRDGKIVGGLSDGDLQPS
jgi:hypothetical protein